MFTGLPCWSSHLSSRSGYTCIHQHSPGCHCPVTSNQQREPLLTFSLVMSTIFFVLVHSTYYAKGLIPKYGIHTCSYSLIHQNEFFCLYFNRVNCSTLFVMESYSCTIPENPVLLLTHSVWKLQLHHWLVCFKFKFDQPTSTGPPVGWCEFWPLVRENPVWCPTLGASLCCGTIMSVHWALQITIEKLAILDLNRFIKSTMNWYPEASKEPFYCILWILRKFTQLAANFTNETLFNMFKTHAKLSHIKFLSHINYIIPLSEV